MKDNEFEDEDIVIIEEEEEIPIIITEDRENTETSTDNAIIVDNNIEEIPTIITEEKENIEISKKEEKLIEDNLTIEPVQTLEEVDPKETDTTNNEEVIPTSDETINIYKEINENDKKEFDSKVDLTPNEESSEPTKKESKVKRGFVTTILFIILIICLILGVFYVYNNSNKVVIKKGIEHLIGYKDYIKKPFLLTETGNQSVKGSTKISIPDGYFKDNIEIRKILDSINKLSFDYSINSSKEENEIEFSINKEKEEILNLIANANDKTGYIFLKDIFDKYIEIEELKTIASSRENLKNGDILKLIEFSYDEFYKNIDKKSIKGQNTVLKIDNKKINSKMTSMTLTEKELEKNLIKVIKSIKENPSMSTILEKVTGTTASEILANFSNKTIENEEMDSYVYTVYTNKYTTALLGIDFVKINKFKQYNYEWDNLVEEDYKVEDEENYKIATSTSKVEYRKHKNPSLSFYEDNKENLSIILTVNDNNLSFNILDREKKSLGTLTYKHSENKYSVIFKNLKNDYFSVDIDIKEIQKNNNYKVTTNAKLSFDKDNILEFVSTYNIKNELIKKIEKIKSSVKSEEITDEEMDLISQKLIKKIESMIDYNSDNIFTDDNVDSILSTTWTRTGNTMIKAYENYFQMKSLKKLPYIVDFKTGQASIGYLVSSSTLPSTIKDSILIGDKHYFIDVNHKTSNTTDTEKSEYMKKILALKGDIPNFEQIKLFQLSEHRDATLRFENKDVYCMVTDNDTFTYEELNDLKNITFGTSVKCNLK
ncbi:MAG: hypothetical protein RR294_04000 [Bacilli bacterium]